MAITQIRRRNGEITDFDRARVEKPPSSAHVRTRTKPIPPSFPWLPISSSRPPEHVFGNLRQPHARGRRRSRRRRTQPHEIPQVRGGEAVHPYRARKSEEREEKQEKLVEQFEKQAQVTKANGGKEYFDAEKIRAVWKARGEGIRNRLHVRRPRGSFPKRTSSKTSKPPISASFSLRPASTSFP